MATNQRPDLVKGTGGLQLGWFCNLLLSSVLHDHDGIR